MEKDLIKKAEEHLSKDPILKKIIKELDMLILPLSYSVYHELTKSIVFQQISYKAAENIYGRFEKLMGSKKYTPKRVLKFDQEELRSVGLSGQKSRYIINIAEFFIEHKIKDSFWNDKSDVEILNYLTEIKGVGEWTVQMILLFQMERPDIFPAKDLAVQIAVKNLYNLESEKKQLLVDMEQIAEKWKPYRSIASRYMWSWKRVN